VRSHDGRATIHAQCSHAVQIGLDEIGFSEHKDFDPLDPVVDYFDYNAYIREIDAARDEFDGRLKIRAGVEVDYQVWFESEIAKYLSSHAFDFVIGSVHYVNREMIMTPQYNHSRDARAAYKDYFAAVRDSVISGLFDIVGHLEYANRRGIGAWGAYHPEPYRESLAALFEEMIRHETVFEINTAGLHQNIGVTYPCEDTVRLYAQAGGTLLSIGSDAHHPDQLAHAHADAAGIALAAGLTQVCTWKNRRRKPVPLKGGEGT
jgi:histidinol-phosphatase (PHP family)